MAKRAVIYCRISQDRTGTEAGVQRQEADCRALCERSGWDIAAVHTDNDISAYSGKRRPSWEAVSEAIKSGTVQVLVGWHPDRFTRQMRELEDLVELVEASGVTIATVTAGAYDLSTPSGRLVARNLGAAARYESEHKAERLRRKHVEIAEAGRRGGGGRRAFGYTRDDRLEPVEAELIRQAARRVIAGDSLRAVLADWNREGVPTVTGAAWQSTTLKRLLCSARISGQREHRGRIVGPAVWPAIISPDDTLRLRAILRDPSRNRAAGVVARSYLLAGFVYCGRCQVKMTTRPTASGRRRYLCVAERGGCDRCGISAEHLEDYVVGGLHRRFENADLTAAADDDGEPALLMALGDVDRELSELAEDYAEGRIGRAGYLAAVQALERRSEGLRAEVVKIHRHLRAVETPAALTEEWDSASFDRRRMILSRWLERVTIAPTTKAGNSVRSNGQRIRIDWF